MGQISKIFTWREYFAPELDTSGCESFPTEFFTHFSRPTAKNFDSVFLTKMSDQMNRVSKFLLIFGRGAPKWVKNPGGKLLGPLA